jgi:hypothetical protein
LTPFPFALAWLNAFQAVKHSHLIDGYLGLGVDRAMNAAISTNFTERMEWSGGTTLLHLMRVTLLLKNTDGVDDHRLVGKMNTQ